MDAGIQCLLPILALTCITSEASLLDLWLHPPSQSSSHHNFLTISNMHLSHSQVEKDFEQVADFLHDALELAKSVQTQHGKLLKDFNRCAS